MLDHIHLLCESLNRAHGGGVGARFDPAVALFDRGFRRQLRLGRSVEIDCDVAFHDRLVAFQPQEIVGAVGDDLVGDGDLAAPWRRP